MAKIIVIIAVILIGIFSTIYAMGVGFGCGFGGTLLECGAVLVPLVFLMVISIVMVVIEFSNTSESQKKHLRLIYFIIAAVIIIFAFSAPAYVDNQRSIAQQERRELIYESINGAIANNDISYCNKHPINKEDCFAGISQTNADPTICDTDQSLRDQCRMTLATARKDPNICIGIIDLTQKQSCINILVRKGDPTSEGICNTEGLSIEEKDTCLFMHASNIESIDVCKKISDRIKRDRCIDEIAQDLKNVNICVQIEDLQKQLGCLWKFMTQSKDDENICYTNGLSNEAKNGCLFQLALSIRSTEICNKISDKTQNNRCLEIVQGR